MPVCRVCDTPANKTSLRTFLSMRPVQKRFGIRYNNNSALYFGCTKATLILYKKRIWGWLRASRFLYCHFYLRFYHLFTYIPCAPWFSCMLVLKLFWLEIGHISFDIIVSLHNGNNVLRWMPHSSRVYLKTVNTPKQRVFSACCAPFSLAIHKVFPRENGFIRRKIPRCWSYCRFSDRP